jgi:uncharacterized protein YgbK (DUF1537 family)
MIAVIADDFTGAAEIAGLGWRHGLRTEIVAWHRAQPGAPARSKPDLVVFDSDSRNLSPTAARRRVRTLALALPVGRPDWVFKKVDSVLRGNVLAEIRALQRTLDLPRALLVPANPNAGRTIRDGIYCIHGTPIDRTDFRHDPRYPRRSPRVLDLLNDPSARATFCCTCNKRLPGVEQGLPPQGVAVGEASTFTDVQHWAAVADAKTLVAGGADFFRALLERKLGLKSEVRSPKCEVGEFGPVAPWLFVCGSLAESSLQFIAARRAEGWPVLLMPEDLVGAGRARQAGLAHWAEATAQALAGHPRVIIGIGCGLVPGARTPERLGRLLTSAVEAVLARAPPAAICVEGGATAAQLIARLGWQRLGVAGEFATGVVGLRPAERPGLLLVCKPGSYAWPLEFV